MSDRGVRMHPINAEQFQALADLARKLDRPLLIDHVADGPDGFVRVLQDGSYKIDRNGRCRMQVTTEEVIEL